MLPILPTLIDPSVSIVICSFNYERFVAEAIDSAIAQTMPCDIVVVDDGSSDASPAIIRSYGNRIRAVFQNNAGQVKAYNVGLEQARGDVVIFLDSDDALEPHAAQTVASMFTAGIAKAHYRLAIVDTAGKPTGATLPSSLARGKVVDAMLRHGLLYSSAPASGNAYRRSVLDKLFPLPVAEGDFVGADFFTVYGSAAFGEVAAYDGVLAKYRIHGQPPGRDASGKPKSTQLTFGNVALVHDEGSWVLQRYQRLRQLLVERTEGRIQLPDNFLDFSFQKTVYASAVLAGPYFNYRSKGNGSLARLLEAIWRQPDYGLVKRLGLSVWGILLPVVPKSTAARMAQYVCNPASRA